MLIITYGWDGTTFPRNAELPYELCYHIDPSGYIFEGTENNLLEGVRATVYYLDKDSGEWIQWDSEAHGEGPNPNISGADGKYGWDVLIGKWKVVFEKDGYYTVESIELDVPPAHLDVNMSMVSTSPAALKEVKAGAKGAYIDFTFDRPVLVDDAKRLVSVLLGGDALDGHVEALNAALTAFGNKQKAGEHDVIVGQNVATKFRFTPEDPIEVGASVKVVGEKGILTYNGIEMAAFESGYVLVPDTVADPITALSYTGIKEIEIGATLDLRADLAITGSEGTLTFKAKTPTLATIDENGVVTALSGGLAYFEITCGTVRTMAAVSVKEAPHTHSFTRELPLLKYLAAEATCTAPAKYYRFCSCGEIGTETFESGEPLPHTFQTEWSKDKNSHWHECSVCGTKKDEGSHIPGAEATEDTPQTCTVCGYVMQEPLGPHSHSYTEKNTDEKYRKSPATCTAKAVYYYSCTCGEKGTETFESGEPLPHTFQTEWAKDKNSHWHECSVCGTKKDEGSHTTEWKIDKAATVTEAGEKHEECTTCGYKQAPVAIDKLAPSIVEGKDAKWSKGGESDLIFKSDAAFTDFVEVLVDGQTVAPEHYDKREGSILVQLKAGYLATLAEGEHHLTIRSASGDATTKFTVEAAIVPLPEKSTNLWVWILLVAVALGAGAAVTVLVLRKRKKA